MSVILFWVFNLVNGFPPRDITGIQPSSSSCGTYLLFIFFVYLSSASIYLFYCKPWP